MSAPQANGHDKAAGLITVCEAIEIAGVVPMHTGSMILQDQIAALQEAAARHAERTAIEALAQDAVRRLADAYRAGDFQKQAEIMREIVRLEFYLMKRNFT